MEAHAPKSGMVLSPAASIPPTLKKSRRARPAPGATSPMRFPQAHDVCFVVQIISIQRSVVTRPCRVARNLSGALERIRHHVQTLSTRASSRPITSPRKMGLARRAGSLALPVQPEMSRTSNNETSDPDEPRYRATPGSDRSLRRASERADARADRDLGAGGQRLRIPVARQQADRRRALRGAEELGSEPDAADARSDRPGAPERKELGRCLPDHEVTGADRRRDARAGPRPLQPRPPLEE